MASPAGPRQPAPLPRSRAPALLLAGGLILAGVLAALAVGRYPVAPADLVRAMWAGLGGAPAGLDDTTRTVVLGIRGPRILAALLVGAALSAAGCAFQALFRNPLVSPDILGASSGAALGAMLAILLGITDAGLQLAAFAGALAAVTLVYRLAGAARQADPLLGLLLVGLVVGALLGAAIGLLKILADPRDQLPAMTFWLLGSLAGIGSADLPALLLTLLPAGALLIALRWRLDALSLPADEAAALGVPVARLRLMVVAAATLATAASVAVAGIVGWIGLVVPHLARGLAGPSFARSLPLSMFLGGGLLLLVDTLARGLGPTELPLGVLTALIGTPCFLWLIRRAGRSAP